MEKVREECGKLIEGFKQLMDSIKAGKDFIARLPFFARGFAAQDFQQSTGMSHDEWIQALDKVIEELETFQRTDEVETLRGAVKRLEDTSEKLLGHLEAYSRYLETIPGKIRQAAAFIAISEEALKNAMEAPRYAEAVRELKKRFGEFLREAKAILD